MKMAGEIDNPFEAVRRALGISSRLRDWIHTSLEQLYRFGEVPEPSIDYASAFAATDTLLDTEEALYGVTLMAWPAGGAAYIISDGILQNLVKRQDALEQLARSLGLRWRARMCKGLIDVNQIRVRAAGHSSDHTGKSLAIRGSTFYTRSSPGPFKVQTGTFVAGGGYHSETIDLIHLTNLQETHIVSELKLIWGELLSRYPAATRRVTDELFRFEREKLPTFEVDLEEQEPT